MAVTLLMYGKLGANIFGGEVSGDTFSIDYLSDNVPWSLHTTTYAPDVDTHETFTDATNELGTANGYTAGGTNLSGKTVTYNATGNKTVFDATDPSQTASGGSLTWRYMVFRKNTGTASTSPLIGYGDFASHALADGNTDTYVLNATDGLFYATAI